MPVIESARKQMRRSRISAVRNANDKVAAKKAAKILEKALVDKDTAAAKKALPKAYSKIDMLVKKNIIHKNTAARRKAGLARQLNAAAK